MAMSSPRFERALRCRVLALAVAFTSAFATQTALADSPCELRFDGPSVPDAWSKARHDVDALVAQLTASTTDCRTIAVSPDADGASVVFTTADGRVARRRIGGPRELLPLVRALLVLGPEPAPPPDVAGPIAVLPHAPSDEPEDAPASRASLAPPDANDSARAAGASNGRLLLGAGAGVKGSWPGDTLAAVSQIFVGVQLSRWELAAFGRWEIEHDAQSDASAGRLRFSALGGGAMFGRREALGPLVLLAGARAAVFDAEEERTGQHNERHDGRQHEEFLDPRLGLYAGCIVSESSRLRFRIQIDGDAGLIVHRTELAELPAFPRWNLGLSVGAETAFFP